LGAAGAEGGGEERQKMNDQDKINAFDWIDKQLSKKNELVCFTIYRGVHFVGDKCTKTPYYMLNRLKGEYPTMLMAIQAKKKK